ncbi:S-phase kinase-associated protein 2-like isoform X1 [Argiope bruennichi]|uniref:S-phase kinase-associated protein 2-like isoform X1 n=1 Tax=Argiope bruennichi TaxID=94029 RepID=UPI0024957175|nr:S-phase kinase-associated protein 2-like isoform X1 [Argiope bruennichi]
MPAKQTNRKKLKMPRKRSTKALADTNIIYNRRESFNNSSRNEKDAMQLDLPYSDCDYQPVSGKVRRHAAVQGHNSENLYHKPHKICRDEFVLFRKQHLPQPSGIDYFSKLSDEIILYIFQWLPKTTIVKCSAVCKRWRDLSYDESLWKRYDYGRKKIEPCVLEILLRRGVTILRLAMSEVKSPVFSEEFLQGPQWYSSLQYLDLSMVTISPENLAILLSVCVHLKKLSVENCELNEDCCKKIAQNHELTVLNMAMCTGITPEGLNAICVNCEKLTEWNLSWTNLTTECIEACLPFMPTTIERLNLSGHRETLDDYGLIEALQRCPNMIELDISDCPLLSEHSFEMIVKMCPNLEHLHSSRSYHIPAECNRLLKEMKNFKYLEVFRTLTDKSLASLREYMPNVQINQHVFSTIARPTTGVRRTSIWGLRTRDPSV